MPYYNIAQSPYPPSAAPSAYDLVETAQETAEEIHRTPSFLDFIDLQQRGMLGDLPAEFSHMETALIQSYAEECIPVITGPPWLGEALYNDTNNRPHASECTSEMVGFIQEKMQQRVQDGFSILLPAADTVRIFGERINIYHIAEVPQAQC